MLYEVITLLPGLEEVGRRFGRNQIFLPQVMLSAETMQTAFSRLKQELKGDSVRSLGKILMATVEGDIHDIGKNIVCTLLDRITSYNVCYTKLLRTTLAEAEKRLRFWCLGRQNYSCSSHL